MKEFLKKLIASKEARANELRELIKKAETADEVRSLGATLDAILAELNEAKEQLASVEEGTPDDEGRGFNPMGQYQMRTASPATIDKLSSMEYRTAFKDFVQKGVRSDVLNVRADEQVSTDLGILLPNTIVQEIIKGVEKVYGQLYSRVRHTSVKGGVQYPIGAFEASLVWGGKSGTDTEHGVSDNQKAGGVDEYVEFTYHIGEIRIAQSLLQTVVTVEAFEKEIVNALVEAYVRAMDIAILEGTGAKQPKGVLVDSRVTNVVEFTAEEMADWTSWKKKLFAKIPLAMRGLSPEFVMTANTFEANIETLVDGNGNPVARELSNPVNGTIECKFWAKNVVLVEESTSLKNFDDATAGQIFGIYWVPEKAYAINTNMQFGYKKYFDENTNQYITKALVIVDGKVLDPKYIYLLKKAA